MGHCLALFGCPCLGPLSGIVLCLAVLCLLCLAVLVWDVLVWLSLSGTVEQDRALLETILYRAESGVVRAVFDQVVLAENQEVRLLGCMDEGDPGVSTQAFMRQPDLVT